MNTLTAITSVNWSCEDTLRRLRQSLRDNGLRVLETFDLQNARLGIADCECPRHGTAECADQKGELFHRERGNGLSIQGAVYSMQGKAHPQSLYTEYHILNTSR